MNIKIKGVFSALEPGKEGKAEMDEGTDKRKGKKVPNADTGAEQKEAREQIQRSFEQK